MVHFKATAGPAGEAPDLKASSSVPPASLWQVVQMACAAYGMVTVVGRIRDGRPTATQLLVLVGFCAWLGAAVMEVLWPLFQQVGADVDHRRLVTNLRNVAVLLVLALVTTTFGIRERLRPIFLVSALAAALVVWWLPGHGSVVELGQHSTWSIWLGMGLHLVCIAVIAGSLLEVGSSRYRVGLPLSKLMNLRFLHAAAVAALAYAGMKGLLFVGVQAKWLGLSPEAAEGTLSVFLSGYGVLFWLALAPPRILMTLAARIDATVARDFAIAFALQTKNDLVRGRDLGWRAELIALVDHVARTMQCSYDEIACLRLSAALMHTDLELRAVNCPLPGDTLDGSGDSAVGQNHGVHSAVARTVWVPADVIHALVEVERPMPRMRVARVLKVVDSYVAVAESWHRGSRVLGGSSPAMASIERRYPSWEEAAALRRVLVENEAG